MKRAFLLLTLLFGSLHSVVAQGGPFFEHTDALRFAYATELVGLYLDILSLDTMPLDTPAEVEGEEEAEEGEEEGLLETALPLFAGSLEARDPALLEALEAALADTQELTEAEATAAPKPAIVRARALLEEAKTALVPEVLSGDPTFQAARIVQLAALEPGVGEGYEEAAGGEREAYLVAWTGLQRIEELWRELEPSLAGSDTEGIARALATLDHLIASPEPPSRFRDPEDAEGAVNDLAFALEAATGARVLPRDLPGLITLIRGQVEAGCAASRGGQERLAAERAAAAGFYYHTYLSDTLSVLGGEVNERIGEQLEGFQEDPLSGETPARCNDLLVALEEAGEVFGG